ncbi:GPW/gp25 family protein [Pyxidicoccus caerfyrddinensis]|uniref:GPW/gp25 family protein n=1 Tax=Pyxidicoccus caerfyrddinensis TaxID=2709663 RepID=UPI0013DAB7EB|nr:GPW/gp25 family protein [Pyxidicoccus caerfyrddinensis]
MPAGRERLFGNDLLLREYAEGLDLSQLQERGPGGDLALARGNTNIIQALTLRLRVRKGELAPLGWPAYGSRLHELIGEPNVPRTHLKLQAFARQAIEMDPRVLKVESVRTVNLPGERDTVRLMLDIQLIDAPSPLNLVFDLSLEKP